MDWMTKLEIARQWNFMPDIKRQAAMRSYLMLHPAISTSDDWWLFLARLFGIGKIGPGHLNLERQVSLSSGVE